VAQLYRHAEAVAIFGVPVFFCQRWRAPCGGSLQGRLVLPWCIEHTRCCLMSLHRLNSSLNWECLIDVLGKNITLFDQIPRFCLLYESSR
jgi:hypothetical protein